MVRIAHLLVRIAAILWASPYTLFGLMMGAVGLLSGGHCQYRTIKYPKGQFHNTRNHTDQYRRGAIEFYGGAVTALLARLPVDPMAMTLGHVILGCTAAALDIVREHEHVHVRQYERWGPLFGPAYLLCSLLLWMKGRDAYRDNPFEKEAYDSEQL